MKPDHLTVAGGLLELMMRVQDGRATCLYAARLIEDMHNAEVDKTETDLKNARASISAIHCCLIHSGHVEESLRLALRDECEHVVPQLSTLRPHAHPI